MNLEPRDDRVLVQPIEENERTPGGIFLPDNAKEKPTRGRILAVGPGRRVEGTDERIQVAAKVGDVVIYSKYAGTEIKKDGELVVLLREEDLLCGVTE